MIHIYYCLQMSDLAKPIAASYSKFILGEIAWEELKDGFHKNKNTTYVFSEVAVRRRRPEILEHYLLKENKLLKARIGKTTLMMVSAEDAIHCANKMMNNNIYFYALG